MDVDEPETANKLLTDRPMKRKKRRPKIADLKSHGDNTVKLKVGKYHMQLLHGCSSIVFHVEEGCSTWSRQVHCLTA